LSSYTVFWIFHDFIYSACSFYIWQFIKWQQHWQLQKLQNMLKERSKWKCLGKNQVTNLSYYTNKGPEEGRTKPKIEWERRSEKKWLKKHPKRNKRDNRALPKKGDRPVGKPKWPISKARGFRLHLNYKAYTSFSKNKNRKQLTWRTCTVGYEITSKEEKTSSSGFFMYTVRRVGPLYEQAAMRNELQCEDVQAV
jgi:hypothetical protein